MSIFLRAQFLLEMPEKENGKYADLLLTGKGEIFFHSCDIISTNFQLYSTCFLRILFIQFAPRLSVPDTEMSQEVNKERSVEILAQLVQNKPLKLGITDRLGVVSQSNFMKIFF